MSIVNQNEESWEEASSDSDDDVFEDSHQEYEDLMLKHGRSEPRQGNSQGSWSYFSYSKRGASIYGNLHHRIVRNDSFKLEYNAIDHTLLTKAKAEMENTLAQVRMKLFKSNNKQTIGPGEAFAGALPPDFFKHFDTWMKTAHSNDSSATAPYSFGDICEFLRCEIKMRTFGVSASAMQDFGVSKDSYERYCCVRSCMTKADK